MKPRHVKMASQNLLKLLSDPSPIIGYACQWLTHSVTLSRLYWCDPGADMEFVQNFTPPDFQAKNFTPSISPNFNSFSKKKHKKWVKIEKFTPLAKLLQSRRHWRHGQIPPLRLSPNFCYSVVLWTFHVTPILYQSKCPASVRTIQIDI